MATNPDEGFRSAESRVALDLTPNDLESRKVLGDFATKSLNQCLSSLSDDNLAAAAEYCSRAQEVFANLGDKGGQATALSNLGFIAQDRHDLEAADDFGRRALALDIELDRKQRQADDLSNLGINALSRNDYDGAEYYYQRAMTLNIELDRRQRQADDLTNLGDVWDRRGERAKACDYWQRSMSLYEQSGAKSAGNAKITDYQIGRFCRH